MAAGLIGAVQNSRKTLLSEGFLLDGRLLPAIPHHPLQQQTHPYHHPAYEGVEPQKAEVFHRVRMIPKINGNDRRFGGEGAEEDGGRGKRCDEKGDVDNAIREFKQIVVLDRDNGEAFFILGGLYTQKKRYFEAVEAYRQAIYLDYRVSEARVALVSLYEKLAQEERERYEKEKKRKALKE